MNERKYDYSELKNEISMLYASRAYIELKHKIKQTDYFKILGVSRKELVHSNFIAWILNPNEIHGLGEYPLRRFLQLLAMKADKDSYFPVGLDINNIITDNYTINRKNNGDFQVFTEYGIPSRKKKNQDDKDRIDILINNIIIEQYDNKPCKLFIVIENKVNSSEQKGQTQHYYDWAHRKMESDDPIVNGEALCVFLSPGKKNITPECKRYINITYQDLVDIVLEPCLLETNSEKCKFYITEYLRTLSYSAQAGGELVMAYSKDEEILVKNFVRENQELLGYIQEIWNADPHEDSFLNIAESAKGGKDHTRYKFEGEIYYKRGIALEIVKKASLKCNNMNELVKIFQKSFENFPWGKIFISEEELQSGNISEKRFFVDDNQKIILGEEAYYFTNQWGTSTAFTELIRTAREDLGYTIEEV